MRCPTRVMELPELRKKIRERERAVARKIKRYADKRTPDQPFGVALSGSKFDPRRPGANPQRYTRKQAEAYLSSLNSFMDRGTQFVGIGRTGAPVTREQWGAYKNPEKKFNRKKLTKASNVANVAIESLPGAPTVAERQKAIGTRGNRNAPIVNPFEPMNRQPFNLAGVPQLAKLTKHMKYMTTSEWENKQMANYLKLVREAGKAMGSMAIYNRVRKLSKDQLYFLMNHTNFVADISEKYEVDKMKGEAGQAEREAATESLKEAREHIEFVKGKRFIVGG